VAGGAGGKRLTSTAKQETICCLLLFRVISQSVIQVYSDCRPLTAQIGFSSVLYTWNRARGDHPCLLPSIGRSARASAASHRILAAVLNLMNRWFLLDSMFGGAHYADPRHVYLQIRCRFHY
jgi:hypothetical protein